MKITGVHEHAEYYPMLSEEQLEELAADIKENGQRDPITVTSDGILIDGRNRWEACKRLGIEPAIKVEDPKDVGSFVRSRNERRHQSTGSRAMSTALSLEHDGKRKNGRWERGSIHGDNTESRVSASGRTWTDAMRQSGLVLDLLPDLAWQVVDGTVALDDAYRRACHERDKREAEQQRIREEEEREVKEEADAVRYFQEHPEAKAWLDNKPEGSFDTMREAFNARMAADRKERMAEEARRRKEKEAERERLDVLKRSAAFVKSFISGFDTAYTIATGQHHDKQGVLDMLEPSDKQRFINIMEAMTWPKTRP